MRVHVRPLERSDREALRRLEADVLGAPRWPEAGPPGPATGHGVLGALAGDHLVGALRYHVSDQRAACAGVTIRAGFQRTRVTWLLLAAFARTAIHRVGVCGFLEDPADAATRALLGGARGGSSDVSPSPPARRAWYARVGLAPVATGARRARAA